jgi:hypothetical protein
LTPGWHIEGSHSNGVVPVSKVRSGGGRAGAATRMG